MINFVPILLLALCVNASIHESKPKSRCLNGGKSIELDRLLRFLDSFIAQLHDKRGEENFVADSLKEAIMQELSFGSKRYEDMLAEEGSIIRTPISTRD